MVNKPDNATGDSQLSESYAELNRRDSLSPSVDLDAAILAEAHRAVGAGPKPATRSRFYRLAPPLAMAATVVLTATLVVLVPMNDNQLTPEPESVSTLNKTTVNEFKREKKAKSQSAAAVAQSPALKSSTPTKSLALEGQSRSSQVYESSEIIADAATLDRSLEEAAAGVRIEHMHTFSAMMESDSDSNPDVESAAASESIARPQALASPSTHNDSVENSRDPEQWREDIDTLLDEKKWHEADQEFRLFKETYPDHEYVDEFVQRRKELTTQ